MTCTPPRHGGPNRPSPRRPRIGWTAALLVLAAAAVAAQPPTGAPTSEAPAAVASGGPGTRVLQEAVAGATTGDPPAALRWSNREIAVLRATVLLRVPSVRVAGAERQLHDLTATERPEPVRVRALAGAAIVSAGPRDLFAIVPADLDPSADTTVDEEARRVAARLQQALDEAAELRAPWQLLQAIVLAVLATITFVVILRLLRRLHIAVAARATRVADRQLQRLPGGEIMRGSRLVEGLRLLVSAASVAAGLVVGYSWLTFVLRRFPYTRPWGEALREFLLQRIMMVGNGMLDAVPDLFTVLLIVLVTRTAIRLAGLVFRAVEEGRVAIPWMYPETVQPTRRLVNGLLWLFALALAYPHLPGSGTDAFKGVSVFVGLMISLGSSGIVNQVMSGFTLTYSRALRLNDFVRIGDVEGTVTHLGSLSTKIKTPRREEVTIPNAVVVGAQTTNYSRLAETEGVFVATAVTIGYDTPWRQVKALLLIAASRTSGVRRTPPAVVRQSALQDFYVEYTLLVCLADPASRAVTLDELHGHILDAFNEHGVQIMSPNYEADPNGPKIVPRDRWFASPAAPAAES